MKHYPGLAGRACVSVLHLLLDSLQQPAVVSWRRDGLSANILHRAEGLSPQAQVVETLLEQRVSMAGHLRIYKGQKDKTF